MGKVAYKLQLPASSQIHPVLHVSQLKKKTLPPTAALSTDEELQLLFMLDSLPPTQVLAHRLQLIGHRVVPSVLVQRESCPPHWAIWQAASTVPRLLSASTSASTARGRAEA